MYSPQQAPVYYDPNPYNQPVQPPPPQYYPPPQPFMQPPPPPQPQVQPTIIIQRKREGETPCQVCGIETPSYPKRAIGAGNFIWCVICCLFIGPFGLIALCIDQFGDLEMRCSRCTHVKSTLSNL